MARLMIVGDSHVSRVSDFLETPRCDTRGITVTCMARGGLRADETRNFLIEKIHEIHQFQPTHAILHVGVCDLLPVSLLEPPAMVDEVLYRVCEAGRYLEEVATPGLQPPGSASVPSCLTYLNLPGKYTTSSWPRKWSDRRTTMSGSTTCFPRLTRLRGSGSYGTTGPGRPAGTLSGTITSCLETGMVST